ncbi:MAG: spore coat protein [Bacilli bacterium]|nr:spore coat protein [Bacilli bacterium]
MNEQAILLDVLTSLKNMSVNLTIALNEASCDNVYNLYLEQFKEVNKYAKLVYDLMSKKGYYQLCDVSKEEKNKVIKKLKKEC